MDAYGFSHIPFTAFSKTLTIYVREMHSHRFNYCCFPLQCGRPYNFWIHRSVHASVCPAWICFWLMKPAAHFRTFLTSEQNNQLRRKWTCPKKSSVLANSSLIFCRRELDHDLNAIFIFQHEIFFKAFYYRRHNHRAAYEIDYQE